MELQYLQRAIARAVRNVQTGSGGPFGAVITRNGVIISEAGNTVTTSCDPTAHAEVNAIRAASLALGTFDLAGCEIYSSCEPCPMCLGAIYWAHLDRVYFAATRHDAALGGFDDRLIYDEFAADTSRRRIPLVHVPRPDARAPFEAWWQRTDRVAY